MKGDETYHDSVVCDKKLTIEEEQGMTVMITISLAYTALPLLPQKR